MKFNFSTYFTTTPGFFAYFFVINSKKEGKNTAAYVSFDGKQPCPAACPPRNIHLVCIQPSVKPIFLVESNNLNIFENILHFIHKRLASCFLSAACRRAVLAV